jgi:predicted ATPase
LRQSYQQRLLPSIGLSLNGELVNIGTARDALFEEAQNDQIEFTLTFNNRSPVNWRFGYDPKADILGIISPNVPDNTYDTCLFGDDFQYLQAERLGPRTSFDISDFAVRQHRQLGARGEYTTHFLSIFRDDEIPISNLSHPRSASLNKSLNLLSQVEAWLGEISPGTRIHILDSSSMSLVNLQYSFRSSEEFWSKEFRATNVGFGITYTLPIITAILSAKPGALLLLENPEAHLHPKGQARMGSLLAKAAANGVQIILETHSDHVLNGVRLAVHGGELNPDAVRLHYFQISELEGRIISEVISPQMNRKGRIDRWPDGFFDEWDNSLAALLQPIEE